MLTEVFAPAGSGGAWVSPFQSGSSTRYPCVIAFRRPVTVSSHTLVCVPVSRTRRTHFLCSQS
ncbi:protein of unknown function [Paraburkholderia kururiensis]